MVVGDALMEGLNLNFSLFMISNGGVRPNQKIQQGAKRARIRLNIVLTIAQKWRVESTSLCLVIIALLKKYLKN
jgi:hypothetical protein